MFRFSSLEPVKKEIFQMFIRDLEMGRLSCIMWCIQDSYKVIVIKMKESGRRFREDVITETESVMIVEKTQLAIASF